MSTSSLKGSDSKSVMSSNSQRSVSSTLEKAKSKLKKVLGGNRLSKKGISAPIMDSIIAFETTPKIVSADKWSEYPEVIESGVLDDPYYAPEVEKQKIAFSIYKSEVSYLTELEAIKELLDLGINNETLINCIKNLIECHFKLYEELDNLYANSYLVNDFSLYLSRGLQRSAPYYITLLGEFTSIMEQVDRFFDSNPENVPLTAAIQLKRQIFSPLKRLHLYFDSTKTILAKLPKDFPDYSGFIKFKEQIDTMFLSIETRRKKVELRKQLATLRSSIEPTEGLMVALPEPPSDYTQWDKDFTIYGNESFVNYKFNQPNMGKIRLVLLETSLLILEENSKDSKYKYKLKYTPIRLSKIEVLEIPDVRNARHMFQIKSKKQGMIHIIQCPNESTKSTWLRMLRQLITRDLSMTNPAKAETEEKSKNSVDPNLLDQLPLLGLFVKEYSVLENLAQLYPDLQVVDPNITNIRCKLYNFATSNGKVNYDEIGVCQLSFQISSEYKKVQLVISIEQTGRLYVNTWTENIEHIQLQDQKRLFIICPVTNGKLSKLLINFKSSEIRDQVYSVLQSEKEKQDAKHLVKRTGYVDPKEKMSMEDINLEHYDYTLGFVDFVPDTFDMTNDVLLFQAYMTRLFEWKDKRWNAIESGLISIYSKEATSEIRVCYQKHVSNTVPLNNVLRSYCNLEVIGGQYLGIVFEDSIVRTGNVHKLFILELASKDITKKIVALFEKNKVLTFGYRDLHRLLEECSGTIPTDNKQHLRFEDIDENVKIPNPIEDLDDVINQYSKSEEPAEPQSAEDSPEQDLSEPEHSEHQSEDLDEQNDDDNEGTESEHSDPEGDHEFDIADQYQSSDDASFKTCEGEDSRNFDYFDFDEVE